MESDICSAAVQDERLHTGMGIEICAHAHKPRRMSAASRSTWEVLPPNHWCLTDWITTRCAETQPVGPVHWTAPTASVRHRPSSLINLYDWVTRSCVQTALGPSGSMIEHRECVLLIVISTARLPVSSRTCHRHRPDVAAPVLTLKSSCFTRRWCPSTSPTPASSPRSARLSTDHACCFHTAERGGAHLPWRRRASGSWECHLFTVRANQLRLTSNRHSVTVWNWKTH